MKSTGEAIGYDDRLTRALYKALQASGMHVTNYGTVFVTVADRDKEEALPLVRRFYRMGFNIQATEGTARFLKANGIRTHSVGKIHVGSQEIFESFRAWFVNYFINTQDPGDAKGLADGRAMRQVAVQNNVTMFTSLDTVRFLLDVLEETAIGVCSLDVSY